jgi:ZIP family zinc transporter
MTVVAFLITCGAGLCTWLGALLIYLIDLNTSSTTPTLARQNTLTLSGTLTNTLQQTRTRENKIMAIGMSFSAGVMLYVSLVDILAKSTERFDLIGTQGTAYATLCLFSGMGMTFLLDVLVHAIYHRVHHTGSMQESLQEAFPGDTKQDSLITTAWMVGIAIALHNFPEGLATYVLLSTDLGAGIPLAFAIACHNIPEGLAVALPVYYKTKSKSKALLAGFLSGLTEPLGGLVGFTLVSVTAGISDVFYAVLFGLVGGMMLYVSFHEMIPLAYRYDPDVVPYGIFGGMLVMALSLVFFSL